MQHADGMAHGIAQGIAPPFAEPIFWVAAAICLVAEVAILRFAFTTRSDAHATALPQSPRGAEMMWAVIPAIGLALLLAATWRAIN
jgi:heme/copper-type cytochrome/quinol oxidase subunit 2